MNRTDENRRRRDRAFSALMEHGGALPVAMLLGCWAACRAIANLSRRVGAGEPWWLIHAQSDTLDALSDRLGSRARAVGMIHQTIGRRMEDNRPPATAPGVAPGARLATPMQQTQHDGDNPVPVTPRAGGEPASQGVRPEPARGPFPDGGHTMREDPPRTVDEVPLATLLADTQARLQRTEQGRRTLRRQNRELRRRIKRLEGAQGESVRVTSQDGRRETRGRTGPGECGQ